MKILLISNEKDKLKELCYDLEARGYEPFIVSDADLAYGIIKENPDKFDLIIADQEMRNCSGAELFNKLYHLRGGFSPFALIVEQGHARTELLSEFDVDCRPFHFVEYRPYVDEIENILANLVKLRED